ncbi:hypothetical protein J7M23_04140 [Candidatus Sumerlaeota bacterium]|nr:hypothetical protein [Candidatus Sumerlaeota bacterium]
MENHRLSLYSRHYLLLSGIFLTVFIFLFKPWQGSGCDDVFYYTYLSSFLFDCDIDPMNDYYLSHNSYSAIRDILYRIGPKGLVINQWAIGSSVLWFPVYLPVRLVGMMLNLIQHSPPEWVNDRYSLPHLMAISFGTLIYGFLTLLLVYSTCRFLYRSKVALLAVLGAVFASPMLAYTFNFSAMSHTMSAFSVALLFYISFRERHFYSLKSYMLISSVLALASLVRWQNIIFGLLPASFWISHLISSRAKRAIGQEIRYVLTGVGIFLTLFSIQLVYWWAMFGKLFTIPQGGGYMNWTEPKIYKVLFSGWHGLYYWHPLLLIATAGLFVCLLRRKNRLLNIVLILLFVLVVYINASPIDWFAGSSFGARRFCSAIPLFALGLAGFYNLFRRRLYLIPLVITIVAIIWNVFLFVSYSQGVFDIYYLNELWLLKGDLGNLLFKWVRTIPLNSYIIVKLLVPGGKSTAILILATGILVVGCIVIFVLKGVFLKLENKFKWLILFFIGVFILLDILLFMFPPGVDTSGIEFANVLTPGKITLPSEKKRIVQHLISGKYRNPGIYFYAVEELGEKSALSGYLDAVYEISPRLWAKWVRALWDKEIDKALLKKARTIKEPRFQTAGGYYWKKINHYNKKGELKKEKHWLKKVLDYNPFNLFALEKLTKIYERQGKKEKARALQVRLRHFLEAKFENYLLIENKIAPWEQKVFEENFLDYAMKLASLYEESGEIEKAIALYEQIERRYFKKPIARQRKLILQAKLNSTEFDSKILLNNLDTPETDIDTFIHAIQLSLASGNLNSAIEIIKVGFKYYSDNTRLYYWLNQILGTYPPEDIPFDSLLSVNIESPRYWLSIAEQLNRAKRFNQALKVMKDVMILLPDDAWSNFVYGYSLFYLRRFNEAEFFFRKAFKSAPDYPAYGIFLTRSLLEQHKITEAMQIINQTLERNPHNADVKYWKKEIESHIE